MLQFRLNEDGKSYTCTGVTNHRGKKITIPKTHNRLPVTRISDNAFYCGYSLESVTIPNSVTEIGSHAFEHCKSLKSIILSNRLTEISDYAFYCCSSLESIIISNSVTKINECAFARCSSLKSTIISNSVTEIGKGAFYGCTFEYTTRRFKATKADNSCKNFIYEIGKWYHEDDIELCSKGFHSCKSPLDVFNYYCGVIGKDIKLYEVATKNESSEECEDSKVVSQDICLLREISISELADIASGRV